MINWKHEIEYCRSYSEMRLSGKQKFSVYFKVLTHFAHPLWDGEVLNNLLYWNIMVQALNHFVWRFIKCWSWKAKSRRARIWTCSSFVIYMLHLVTGCLCAKPQLRGPWFLISHCLACLACLAVFLSCFYPLLNNSLEDELNMEFGQREGSAWNIAGSP